MVAISDLFAPRGGELQECQDEKDDAEHHRRGGSEAEILHLAGEGVS